jgi:predicted lipase
MKDLREIRLQTKLETLYITGISLGGGLAVISFIDINHDKIFPTVKVTTYGAPRVGNKHWAEHFDLITNNSTRRYIVEGDPIVVMPRCLTLLCTYRQTGIKIVCREELAKCTQEH